MKQTVIQKFEYQTLRVGEPGFTKEHFERLVSYNDLHQSKFFVVGHDRIFFKNYVGVINVCNLTIEILPKIDQHCSDDSSMRDMLVRMLHRTGDLPLEETEVAPLKKTMGSLFELYIRLFLWEVRKLVIQGLPKHYSSYRSNEPFVKGRLLLAEQLRYNLFRKDKNYIEYKRFSVDHRFNHILKYALQIVANISISMRTNAKNLLTHFESVPDLTISTSDFQKLHFTRKTECYRLAITLAELIITGFQPDLKHGDYHVVAFLFDMNSLFEKYVTGEIRREISRSGIPIKLKAQATKVFWRHADSNSRKLIRPDIVLDTPNNSFVLDTKWKILHDVYSDDDDLKQLYTYSLQFEVPHVFLIYPSPTEKHVFSHGYFQPSQNGKCHGVRNITQWQIPLLDKNGFLNRSLGKEVLLYLTSSKQLDGSMSL